MPQPQTHEQSRALQITAPVPEAYRAILTPEACSFIEGLASRFMERRDALLPENSKRNSFGTTSID